MSTSLQYSNYTGRADLAIPYQWKHIIGQRVAVIDFVTEFSDNRGMGAFGSTGE